MQKPLAEICNWCLNHQLWWYHRMLNADCTATIDRILWTLTKVQDEAPELLLTFCPKQEMVSAASLNMVHVSQCNSKLVT